MTDRTDRTKRIPGFIIAVAVAFALVLGLLPVYDLGAHASSGKGNTEPTLPASEMTRLNHDQGDGAAAQGGGMDIRNDGTVAGDDAEMATQDNAATTTTGDATTTTGDTTTTTTAPPETTTTTVNTSGKGWVTPKGSKALSLTLCCNTDGSFFDLTAQAGQHLYGYDTLQGATAGRGYGYFTLYNRDNNHVIFVKVLLSEMRVVKVSAPLPTDHSNEITYNGRNNTIVVANSTPRPKRLTVINADTLEIMYHKDLKMTGKVSGMSKKQRKKFKGVGAIAYNEKHNNYVCLTRKSHDLLFLKANFKPYKKIKQKKKVNLLYQGMDSYQDCVMVCQSFKGKKNYNLISVYNMKGKLLARFKMSVGSPAPELETVFHDGNQFYAGFYMFFGARADDESIRVQRLNSIYRIDNL